MLLNRGFIVKVGDQRNEKKSFRFVPEWVRSAATASLAAAVLKAAPNAEAAKEFLAYLQTDKAMTVFEGVGFSAV